MPHLWQTFYKDKVGPDGKPKPHPNWKFKVGGWKAKPGGGYRPIIGTGTASRAETLRMANKAWAEARAIRKDPRLAPKESDIPRPFDEVVKQFLDCGASQGQRGRAWSPEHTDRRRKHLDFWRRALGAVTIHDVTLGRVEAACRDMQARGKSGKTIRNWQEAIHALTIWAKRRHYLAENPLESMVWYNGDPKTVRRALTAGEVRAILDAAPTPAVRLGLEMAVCSGLRVNELRSLQVKHLVVAGGDSAAPGPGVYLDAHWTKARKPGFQRLPAALAAELAESARGQKPDELLLVLPRKPREWLYRAMERAGIPRQTPEGKIDFHAFRASYATLLDEAGAHPKEIQELCRHASLRMTAGHYMKTRRDNLQQRVESIGRTVGAGREKSTTEAQRLAAGAEGVDLKACDARASDVLKTAGAGGLRPRILPSSADAKSAFIDKPGQDGTADSPARPPETPEKAQQEHNPLAAKLAGLDAPALRQLQELLAAKLAAERG